MGMFDTLYVSKSLLPITDEQKATIPDNPGWQTKDFDCLLTKVFIIDEGKLKIDRTPDGWFYSTQDQELLDDYKSIERKLDTLEHHRYVRFYSNIGDEWFEFKAKFTDGKLVTIKRT